MCYLNGRATVSNRLSISTLPFRVRTPTIAVQHSKPLHVPIPIRINAYPCLPIWRNALASRTPEKSVASVTHSFGLVCLKRESVARSGSWNRPRRVSSGARLWSTNSEEECEGRQVRVRDHFCSCPAAGRRRRGACTTTTG